MLDGPILQVALFAALGFAMQELVHWYSFKEKLVEATYQDLFRSRTFWAIIVGMFFATGIGSWAWFSVGNPPTAREAITFGAAFPLLVKKLSSKGDTMGPSKIDVRSIYFS